MRIPCHCTYTFGGSIKEREENVAGESGMTMENKWLGSISSMAHFYVVYLISICYYRISLSLLCSCHFYFLFHFHRIPPSFQSDTVKKDMTFSNPWEEKRRESVLLWRGRPPALLVLSISLHSFPTSLTFYCDLFIQERMS